MNQAALYNWGKWRQGDNLEATALVSDGGYGNAQKERKNSGNTLAGI